MLTTGITTPNCLVNLSKKKYLMPFSHCFITAGERRFTIFDSSKGKLHRFDNIFYDFLIRARHIYAYTLIKEHAAGHNAIYQFVEFLINEELATFVSNVKIFPSINEDWEFCGHIKSLMIDIRNIWHDLDAILSQLSHLMCKELEIRSYRVLSMSEIQEISMCVSKYDIDTVILIIPYDVNFQNPQVLGTINNLIENDYRLRFLFYGLSEEEYKIMDDIKCEFGPLFFNVSLSMTQITGPECCGNIDISKFHSLNIQSYMENKLYNSCLNKKISIDENGDIKNCPSMKKKWGNISSKRLLDVYYDENFQSIWKMSNSKVNDCKNCEFRCICLGCRAYVMDSQDFFSKPSKCSYNPFI